MDASGDIASGLTRATVLLERAGAAIRPSKTIILPSGSIIWIVFIRHSVARTRGQRRSEQPLLGQKGLATRTAFHANRPSSPSWRDSARIGLCPMIFRMLARSCMMCGASEKRPPVRCQLRFRPVPPYYALALLLRWWSNFREVLDRGAARFPIESVTRLKTKQRSIKSMINSGFRSDLGDPPRFEFRDRLVSRSELISDRRS